MFQVPAYPQAPPELIPKFEITSALLLIAPLLSSAVIMLKLPNLEQKS